MIKNKLNMISSKTKKILIIVSIIAISVLLFDIFFIFSIYKKRDSVAKPREDFLTEMTKESQLVLIKKIIEETSAERTNLNLCFVNNDEVVDFIKSVELISKLAGVSIEMKSVGTENSEVIRGVNVETLVVEVVIEGSWDGTFKFLSLIENIPYNTTIDRVSINKSAEETNKDGSWKSGFTIKVTKI